MYYCLSRDIGLRSWWRVPYAYYKKYERNAISLMKEEYEMLCLCDGKHDLEESEMIEHLLKRGLIFPIEKDSGTLDEWQQQKHYENRYVPCMNWMITGKCNYNCLHCFNASDNAPLQSAFSMEEAEKLMDEAKNCGIHAFTITGGEPMAHPHFLEIVQGIYQRGMYIFELNTNGSFIHQRILNEMKKCNCNPLIKISFDGLGYHDWMRNQKGAEEEALKAIRLCIENGFQVMVQTNINRKNKDAILETLCLLNEMGVVETRIICTTEAPRWQKNAAGASFTITEYFNECLQIAQKYIEKPKRMIVDFWQFLYLDPNTKRYQMSAYKDAHIAYRETLPLCRGNRGMIGVAANGEVTPCLQMSGWLNQHHVTFGNVKKQSLQSLLQDSKYLNEVCATMKDLKEENPKCAGCMHFKDCRGGCRALGLLLSGGNFRGSDESKCIFFQQGYEEKVKKTLQNYQNNQ